MPSEADLIARAHPDLRRVIERAKRNGALFRVICTVRGKAEQLEALHKGFSKANFGQSPHNYQPALAFDFVPLNNAGKFEASFWKQISMFQNVAKQIEEAARQEGVIISYGGNWKSFKDFPHVELDNWKARKVNYRLAQ